MSEHNRTNEPLTPQQRLEPPNPRLIDEGIATINDVENECYIDEESDCDRPFETDQRFTGGTG